MKTRETNLKRVGASGETIAKQFLQSRGWRILEENYRTIYGEIDLIAEEPLEDGVVLVIIEVKARRGGGYGAPAAAVDIRKQTRIIDAAKAYLGSRAAGGLEPQIRFDIAEVFIAADDLSTVMLHRGAFTA